MEGQSLSDEIASLYLEQICSAYHNWNEVDHQYDSSVCKASIVNCYSGDFGGDMNHLHRVGVSISCKMMEFSIVVKIAPDEVKFIKEGSGEEMSVDPRKAELEYSALCKFQELQHLSVPRLYALDTKHKAILMEDLKGFRKLQDVLVSGVADECLTAVERAMRFIGFVHKSTWLQDMNTQDTKTLTERFTNKMMKNLLADLLFDKPFNPTDASNRVNPVLSSDVEAFRTDPVILSHVSKLQESFLQQSDCFCHGDFAPDNVLVKGDEFRIVDMEFAGIGLRAYDVGLFLKLVLFQLVHHHYYGHTHTVSTLHQMIHRTIAAYESEMGEERTRETQFVTQVCGLVACELMWTVFGSCDMEEFKGDPEPERKVLAMSKTLLLECNEKQTIIWNIDRTLSMTGGAGANHVAQQMAKRAKQLQSDCGRHCFTDMEEIDGLRHSLLEWYDANKRKLPWRTLASTEIDSNKRAYGVWVSEVMLQQTQVATVIDYYNRWMKKWPTVESLATATLEEVNTMWAGLGYYSRGQRVWEGAKKVVNELNGMIPDTAEQLAKTLPGVGKYTASAIASIAFGEVTGVVDGNVVRVLSRQRMIGGHVNSKSVTEHLWSLSNTLVDPSRPGDFNQAMMELGATICTPKTPQCTVCPVSTSCRAHQEVDKRSLFHHPKSDHHSKEPTKVGDSPFCLSQWDQSLGVMNYPCKTKRKAVPTEHFAVAVIEVASTKQLLLRQRPSTGLLANLWEFPSVAVQPECPQEEMFEQLFSTFFAGHRLDIVQHKEIGLIFHQFSHVHHHYHSWHFQVLSPNAVCIDSDSHSTTKWVGKSDIMTQPIPTAVKKIYKQLMNYSEVNSGSNIPKRKRQRSSSVGDRKQQKITDCFVGKKIKLEL